MRFESPSDFQARLAIYGIDAQTRAALSAFERQTRPALEAGVKKAINNLSNASAVSAIVSARRTELIDLECRHLTTVLGGEFGDVYLRSCRELIERFVAIGLTPRSHVAIAGAALQSILSDLSARHRFGGSRRAQRSVAATAAVTFDIANAFAIYQDASVRESDKRAQSVDDAIEACEPVISAVVEAVLSASKSLGDGSATLKASALRTVDIVKSASAIANESTQGMAASAQATEELHLSINEISRAVGVGSESSRRAVKNAEDAKLSLDDLVKIAGQVGSVVTAISGIAQQTNLLALNATIEAAHAGAAGRGFAVVASEVKALSARTAEATRQITQQIHAIQESTLLSAERMSEVIDAVTQAASTTNSIAVAIDQQRAVTKSIAETVAKVAEAANRSSADLAAVNESASRGLAASEEIIGWSGRLATGAQTLKTNVTDLYRRVRHS